MIRSRLLPLVLSSVLLSGCSHTAPPPTAQPTVVSAQVVRSTSAMTPQSVPATGTLRAKETATLSAEVPGRVRRVLVQAGDQVRSGQALVVLDDAAVRSALDQATAAAEAASRQEEAARSEASLASATLARYQILKAEKSVSPQEFDQVEKHSQAAQLRAESYAAQVQQARAAVSGARTQLGYSTVHAPFAGVVTARLADPGTLAGPGVPLLQLDGGGPLQAIVTVDETMIGSVRVGLKVPVTIGGLSSTYNGTVAQIIPAADPASHSFQVKLNLADARSLHAGMFATAEFPAAARRAILVPKSAVAMRGSLACVYAVGADGVATLRYVTLGSPQADQVEVLSGLSAGETVVNNPGDRDLSGKRIEVQR